MKRLLLWVILLTMLFSSGIAIAGQRGIGASKPAFAQWFTYPDGKPCPMPCLFGIRPGVTKFDDVDAILKAHPLTSKYVLEFDSFNGKFFNVENADLTIEGDGIGIYSDEWGNVGSICMCFIPEVNPNAFTFESVVYTLGIPDIAAVGHYNTNSNLNYFFYSRIAVDISVAPNDDLCVFAPHSHVYNVSVYSSNKNESFLPSTEHVMRPRKWAGFSTRTYYTRYFAPLGESEVPCTP